MTRTAITPDAPLARPNGVNRYVRELLERLPGTELVRRDGFARLRPARLAHFDVIHVPYERLRRRPPVRGRPVVATVMGLGGLDGRNPDPSARRDDSQFVEAIQTLEHVTWITPTHATRDVVCSVVDIDCSNVEVIPLGVDHDVFHPIASGLAHDTAPTERPYLLHVGPYSARKHAPLLLEAFASIRHDVPDALVWVGVADRSAIERDAARLGISDRMIVSGPLSDASLAAAYRHATALCVPSRYEGFGLPALEAMACGTSVIVSDSPALVEVAGGAAVVVSTNSGSSDLAAAIGHVATSADERTELRARGIARAAEFSWDHCARRHGEIYTRLHHDRDGHRADGHPAR